MTASKPLSQIRFTILMPVYNDWTAASQVITEIDAVLADSGVAPRILLVDDGSTLPPPNALVLNALKQVTSVDILKLRRNLGHQRAIAIGLTHIFNEAACDAVVVMDSDGEDRPIDVPRIMEEYQAIGGDRFVFAKRTKRPETALFKVCYRCYQLLHRAFTGLGIAVGNFSVIPFPYLSSLVVSPELWNHYAAAVFKQHLPVSTFATPRGPRFSGTSKMNFVSLVIHGLSAISVYAEIVGTRTLVAAGALSVFLMAVLAGVVGVRLFTHLAVPGWATYSSGLLLVLLMLVLTTASGFVLFVLGSRNSAQFLPIRDYAFFIEKRIKVFPPES